MSDIELRIVRKRQRFMEEPEENVLQFRVRAMVPHANGGYVLGWTRWADVPVVDEEGD